METFLRYAIAIAMLAVSCNASLFLFLLSMGAGMQGGDAPFFLVGLPGVFFLAFPLIYAASVLGVVLSYRQQEHVIAWASLPIFFDALVFIALKTWWFGDLAVWNFFSF
jgi:hypothetical protein